MPRRRILSRIVRPSTLAVGGFLVIGAAIVANALFLQAGRHPAPLLATRASARDADQTLPDRVVTARQEALQEAGINSGPVDGGSGTQTIDDILQFEQAAGGDGPADASTEQVAAMQAGASPDPAQGSPAPAASDPAVMAVQRALSQAAYGPLHADGVFGPQTGEAIVRFQRDHGLPTTGEISEALLVELRAAGALEE